MKIENISIDRLIPYARNSRTHSDEQVAQVAASIKEFGFTNPVLIDADGGIIAGHGRVLAARKLALADVPCIRLSHLSEAQKRAYVIADNKLALNSGWDEEMLALEFKDLQSMGFDLELTGFDLGDIDELMAQLDATPEGNTDADETPAVQAEVVSKLGDVWLLGKHKIMCGDSTSSVAVNSLFDGKKADMCFTSPPYGAGNVAKLRDHYVRGAEKRDSFYDEHTDRPDEWAGLMRGWYEAAKQFCDVIVCNVQMLADNKMAMVEWLHLVRHELCDVVIWDKGHGAPQMQKNILNNAFEFIFIVGGNGSRSVPFASFHGNTQNVVRINPKGKNEHAEIHRAVMPVDLALWAMQDLCHKSSSVYEPFSGSGTTLIAAEQTARICYAMELSPAYVDVAVRRWQNYTGKTATNAETGKAFGA
jgi:DNA modification methylase